MALGTAGVGGGAAPLGSSPAAGLSPSGLATSPGVQGGGSASQSYTQTLPDLMNVYNQTFGANVNNYNKMVGAFTGTQDQLAGTLPSIYNSYDTGRQDVSGILGFGGTPWGVASPAAQAISDAFTQTEGQTQEDLINRGLGGSTILSSARNQNALEAGKAYGSLGAQLAQTYAGYASQFDLAKAGAQMQGAQLQSHLGEAYGNALAGYRFANTAGNLTGGFGNSVSTRPPISLGTGTGGVGSAGRFAQNPYSMGGDSGGSGWNNFSNGTGGDIPGQISAASGQVAADQMALGYATNNYPVNPMQQLFGNQGGTKYGDILGQQIAQAQQAAGSSGGGSSWIPDEGVESGGGGEY